MLICASLRTSISTGTKNRIFVLRQFKLADAPVADQFQGPKNAGYSSRFDKPRLVKLTTLTGFLLRISRRY
jgi:hypothetical protein